MLIFGVMYIKLEMSVSQQNIAANRNKQRVHMIDIHLLSSKLVVEGVHILVFV